jgi:CheY-like chemotaxis protein
LQACGGVAKFGAMDEERTDLPPPAEPERAEVLNRERRVDARARVLVVEDEHELRELIAGWLESKGYEAAQAEDGGDAIELLVAGLEPDVIVLDLALPRVDGHAFLKWLRSRPHDAPRPPVIVASGEYDALPAEGVAGVLAKPYRPDLLLRELERALGE